MGSFQIAYDDFSGGHYMGDRTASLPKNTWYGTNAVLNPKGELIPGVAGIIHTFTKPTGTWDIKKIWYGWTTTYNSYFVVSYFNTSTNAFSSKLFSCSVFNGVASNITTQSLTGYVSGTCVNTTAASYANLYYVDEQTGNIRVCDYNFNTDTIVSTALAGYGLNSITNYKSRLLVWSRTISPSRLYYSDTTKSSFSLSNYYSFEGSIAAVVPRSNDLLVITSEGIYSMTGVLGSSINIQLVAPPNELLPGMVSAKASGRSIYFSGEGSVSGNTDNRMYELLGATTREIVRLGLDDIYASYEDQITFNIIEGGNLAIMTSNGAIYIRKTNGDFVRLFTTRANYSTNPEAYIAGPLHDFLSYNGDTVAAVMQSDGDIEFHVIRHSLQSPAPQLGLTTPASATVDLSEYWHQRPFVVKELLVEATYDNNQTLPIFITGDASVAAQIIPTGAIDYSVNETPLLGSSTQTITTDLSTVEANSSRVLHRFRPDNAIKSYGFYPKITWQGCRIRRVIAICED